MIQAVECIFQSKLITIAHCFLIAPGSVGTHVASDTSVGFEYEFDAKNPAADHCVIFVKDSEPKKYCKTQRGNGKLCKIIGLM